MRYGRFCLLSLTLGVSACGCSNSLGRPNWMNPDPVAYQQHQAQRFDPYPDDSLGPPILGGRPREYDRPREPTPLPRTPAIAPYSAAQPGQLQPTPGPYSPSPYSPPAYAPGPYPQTQYTAPQYPATAPLTPAPGP